MSAAGDIDLATLPFQALIRIRTEQGFDRQLLSIIGRAVAQVRAEELREPLLHAITGISARLTLNEWEEPMPIPWKSLESTITQSFLVALDEIEELCPRVPPWWWWVGPHGPHNPPPPEPRPIGPPEPWNVELLAAISTVLDGLHDSGAAAELKAKIGEGLAGLAG